MDFREILNVILPTFIAIIVGYIFGRYIKLDLTGLNQILFYIGLPAVTFVSILDKQVVLFDAARIWAIAILVTFGCGIIAWLIFKIKREKHSGLYLPITLPNTVNIPFPIISLAYGATGLFAAVLYYIPNVIMIFSLGVFVAAGKKWRDNLKSMLKVPTMYAAILALVLNLSHVTVPQFVIRPLDFIGGMVIPAVVLTLGYSLSKIKIASLPTTFIAALVRMGGGLALGFLLVSLFNITGIYRQVIIFMSAMPSAVNTYMITAIYKNEAELVASVIFVTTIASLIMIPVLLYVL